MNNRLITGWRTLAFLFLLSLGGLSQAGSYMEIVIEGGVPSRLEEPNVVGEMPQQLTYSHAPIENPVPGVYTVILEGSSEETLTVRVTYGDGANQIKTVEYLLLHHGTTQSFTIDLDPNSPEIIDVKTPAGGPVPVTVAASAADKVKLGWSETPAAGVTGYRVYSKPEGSPNYTLLGTTTGVEFDTGDDFQNNDEDLTVYAVVAITDPDTEAFFDPPPATNKLNVKADFSASTTAGGAPLTVNFTDLSVGEPNSWEWDFDNDGVVDSTQQNPVYQFTQPGEYTVSLKVDSAFGSDTRIVNQYIQVLGSGSLQVNLSPASVTEVGAQWRVDGGSWREPGETLEGLSAGNHTVEYRSMLGWNTPASEVVTIASDQATITTGNYTLKDGWVVFHGTVKYFTTPICALVLANGQSMFSCAGEGKYALTSPVDSNGEVTIYSFASGFAPYKQTIKPSGEDVSMNMQIVRASDSKLPEVMLDRVAPGKNQNWRMISGSVIYQGQPLCALALANGQDMFTCDGAGSYSLEVPLDTNGNVTLYIFVSGFSPFKAVFDPDTVTTPVQLNSGS